MSWLSTIWRRRRTSLTEELIGELIAAMRPRVLAVLDRAHVNPPALRCALADEILESARTFLRDRLRP